MDVTAVRLWEQERWTVNVRIFMVNHGIFLLTTLGFADQLDFPVTGA